MVTSPVGNAVSPFGRTRTAPPVGSPGRSAEFRVRVVPELPERLLHALRAPGGRGHRPRRVPRRLHLRGRPRRRRRQLVPSTTEAPTDLKGYRLRYGEYKADPLLQLVHASSPVGDHVGRPRGGRTTTPATCPTGCRSRKATTRDKRRFAQRRTRRSTNTCRSASSRPTTKSAHALPRRGAGATSRRFYVLDGRQYRNDQACGAARLGSACAEVGDPEQTMLGGEQEAGWVTPSTTPTPGGT